MLECPIHHYPKVCQKARPLRNAKSLLNCYRSFQKAHPLLQDDQNLALPYEFPHKRPYRARASTPKREKQYSAFHPPQCEEKSASLLKNSASSERAEMMDLNSALSPAL